MEMNKELLEKAKRAKNAEELIALAKENGMEMTEESANAYLDLLHSKNGELADGELTDDELDNVSGGGCHKDGKLVVTVCHTCGYFKCKRCGNERTLQCHGVPCCRNCGKDACCNNCYYCSYTKGLWLCNCDENKQ